MSDNPSVPPASDAEKLASLKTALLDAAFECIKYKDYYGLQTNIEKWAQLYQMGV